MSVRIRVAAALCAAVGVCGASAPVVQLEPMAVSGTAVDVVVEAARARLASVPGAVSVVGREAWEDRYALTLKDTLGFVPGVYAQPRYAEEVRLSIRGSGLSRNAHLRGITFLLDGVPLTLADGSGDFQEIDPALLRLIEVYKGANALAYGASSLGGAINLVTPTARTTEPYRLSLEQGSWETRRGNAQGAWRGETLDGFASLSLSRADGWRDNSQGHSRRLAGNLGWTLGEGVETRLYLARNEIVQAVPGTLTQDAALNWPRSANPANLANQAARNIDSTRVANRTTLALGGGELALTGYAVHKRLDHPLAFGIVDQDGDFHGGSLHYRHARGAQALTLGLQLREGDNAARVFAPLSGAGFSELRADNRERAQHLGVYAQHEWRVAPNWTAISGAQWARDTRDFENRREAERSDQRTYTGFSPRLGLLWQPTQHRQLFANLSRSFEPPTFSELNQNLVGFVPLAAQKATTLEFGGRGGDARHQWEWSVYRAEVEEAFIAFAVNPEQGIPAPVFNAERTVHQGLEAGLASRLWQNGQGLRLSSQLAWTWSDFRFDRDAVYGNNRLAGLPQHVLMAELRLAAPGGLTLRPAVEWVPQGAWIDFANTSRVSGYAVLNLGATLELGRGFQVFLDGRNLANRRSISTFSTVAGFADQALFHPGEARALYSGLRWTGMP